MKELARGAAACLVAAALLGWAGSLQAPAEATLTRWVDDNGLVRYSPAGTSGHGRSGFATDPAAVARTAELALHEDGEVYMAMVRNLLAGPIEVELAFSDHDNVSAWPPLPHRMTIGPGEQRAVTAIEKINPRRGGHFDLHLLAMPGLPGAVHEDVEYLLPLHPGPHIDQGFGGRFSHDDAQNYHAVDFALPVGSPVLAARGGTVMQVIVDHVEAGLDRRAFVNRANNIRVLHEDGSMAVYAHLEPGGSLVAPGERVEAGQHIGRSGNTGFSSGPHLHFVVQVNTGMGLESVPFRLRGPDGPVAIPGSERR